MVDPMNRFIVMATDHPTSGVAEYGGESLGAFGKQIGGACRFINGSIAVLKTLVRFGNARREALPFSIADKRRTGTGLAPIILVESIYAIESKVVRHRFVTHHLHP